MTLPRAFAKAIWHPFWAGHGRLLTFRRRHGYWPNPWRPTTFNEKVLRRAMFDRRPLLQTLSDKLAARNYVRERVGDAVAIPRVVHATRNPDTLRAVDLPGAFALKPNHAQGLILLHVEGEPDRDAMVARARDWLDWCNYERRGQWCYKDIPRTVYVEEHLTGAIDPPEDYKIYCFNGEPRFIQVDAGRFRKLRRDFYDREWRALDVEFGVRRGGMVHPRPPNLNVLLDAARRLSAGFDFLRVDLYDLGARGVWFGEITLLPENGKGRFSSRAWDLEFGRHWR